jgi:hypothetical protein
MTRVYANAIFCSTRFEFDVQSLRLMAADVIEPGWPQHIERAYRCALGFSFNDFYLRRMRLQHVLSASFDAGTRLGRVWSDWVLLDDDRLGTRSLHVGFCFPTLRLELHDRNCAATEAAARFLQDVYQLSERVQSLPGGLGGLSRLLCEHGPKRRNALGLSRYVYTSLVCDDASMLSAPSNDVRVNLYRLLFQHARGVDPAVATAMLPPPWSSAAFFRLYAQPGSIVSLAVPYPPDVRSTHAAWFEPTPPQLAPAPFALAHTGGAEPAAYPSYDRLPEYPPLRYLAWAALHYAAAYEETLRAVHEAAFSSLRQRLFRRGPKPKPLIGHLLAANLEGVRLPVVRDLVDRLLDIQLQERTASAAMERLRMRESAQMLLWAVVAAIAGIAAVVLTGLFVDVKNFIFRHEAPAAQSEPAAPTTPTPKSSQPRP